eukprot:scaffold114510_cov27-Tisochrysis_lutea.AAC.4
MPNSPETGNSDRESTWQTPNAYLFSFLQHSVSLYFQYAIKCCTSVNPMRWRCGGGSIVAQRGALGEGARRSRGRWAAARRGGETFSHPNK